MKSKYELTHDEIEAKKIRNEAANKNAKPHVTYENNFKFVGPKKRELSAVQKTEKNKAKRERRKK